jgi:hypothetical protein
MRSFFTRLAVGVIALALAAIQSVAPGLTADALMPKSVTTSTYTITPADQGRVLIASRAAGITFTLPAATGTGRVYTIAVGTTITSNSLIVAVSSANDFMQGIQWVAQDAGATVNAFETGASDDTCTMDGSTKGGIKGDLIVLIDIVANTGSANTGVWQVEIQSSGTGTEATCFSAAV